MLVRENSTISLCRSNAARCMSHCLRMRSICQTENDVSALDSDWSLLCSWLVDSVTAAATMLMKKSNANQTRARTSPVVRFVRAARVVRSTVRPPQEFVQNPKLVSMAS